MKKGECRCMESSGSPVIKSVQSKDVFQIRSLDKHDD